MKDDWGTPIGADPEKTPEPAPKKKPRQDSLGGLVMYFQSILPRDYYGRLNAPVNGKAMMAGLKKLTNAGKTAEQIRQMMDTFVVEITRKPLPTHVAPWRGFLANLDRLAGSAKPQATNYDELQVDRRL